MWLLSLLAGVIAVGLLLLLRRKRRRETMVGALGIVRRADSARYRRALLGRSDRRPSAFEPTRLRLVLLITIVSATCSGCAGLLRLVGVGGAARAGAAGIASGEAAASLALTRPLAFRGAIVTMDGSAAARIATSQQLA